MPRRRLLVLGAVGLGLAACRADADTAYLQSMDPNAGDDSGNGDDTGDPTMDDSGDPTMDDTGVPGDDVPTVPVDSGNPGRDSGMPHVDSGNPVDTGVPHVDSGPPPVDTGPSCTPGPTMLGATSMFPANSWTKKTSPRVIVAHDSGGFYAFSSVCTHSGCVVDPPDATGQTYCSCHGSIFGPNGQVVQGPARTALAHYLVSVCSGILYINTAMTVSASTRVPG